MTIDECPHCLRKVLFSDIEICSACGESRFNFPFKSREQIIYEKHKNDTIEGAKYCSKRGTRLIIGGSVILIVVIGFIILMAIYKTVIIYWFGGVFIGASMIWKGLMDFQHRRELIFMFEKKYNEKLLNH